MKQTEVLGLGKTGNQTVPGRDETPGMRLLRTQWPLMLIAAILSLFATACEMLLLTDHLSFSFHYAFRFVIYTLFLFSLFYAGDRLLDRFSAKQADNEQGRVQGHIELKGQHHFEFPLTRRGFLGSLGVIYLCWLPYLILTYPGVIWYDTQQQLQQFFGIPNVFGDGSHLSDHHPVFDTLIFGSFVKFGHLIGSGNAGVFLYAIVQSLITASVLALTVLYLRRIGVPRQLCKATMLFFALFPIFPMYSSAMAKDAVFLPYFLLFSLCFVETARTKGDFLRNPWALTAFIVFAVLMALTKKTGLYVVIVACLFLPFFLPKGRRIRAFLPAIITALVMMVALPKVVFPIAGIQEGGKQEVLGIAFQQSARLLREHPNEVGPQDKETIYKVLGRDVDKRYEWWATDSVKGYTWSDEQNKHLGEYMKVWVRNLAEHPVSYVETYLALEQGWLGAPTVTKDGRLHNVANIYALGAAHGFPEAEQLGVAVHRDPSGPKLLQDSMDWLAGTFFGALPFSRALWATWIPVFLVYECLRRRRERFAWLLPMLATFLFLWVSPTSATIEGVRYLVPMIYVAPLSLACLLTHRVQNPLV
ncbi:DUF6020 family protein [Bifidobacterium callitrichos]|nr:DUF6020 family protein [Bifidobacterium callitrichos]